MISDPPRVLCVDDEPRVLEALERNLGDVFDVVTATSGAEALVELRAHGPFDVVVSDMQMPVMNGATLLAHACRIAPDTMRVLLTGHADAKAAMDAVNLGQVHRYLLKPCAREDLVAALGTAVEARKRRLAEREMLETTVRGAIRLLGELLHLAAPACFRDACAVQGIVVHLVHALGLAEPWKYEAAAMLHAVGYLAVPQDILDRHAAGQELTAAEREIYDAYPETSYRLVREIPRLEEVAEMVRRHREPVASEPHDDVERGAGLVRIALDVLAADNAVRKVGQVARALQAEREGWAHELLGLLVEYRAERPQDEIRAVRVVDLRPRMVLDEDVVTTRGQVLVCRGHELTAPICERITKYASASGVREPVRVRMGA
jgi:response regulator RpfG family c-di-GMP phosphodiesterase